MSRPPNSDAVLERLQRLHPKEIDLGLERTRALLADLGNPHQRLPPVVHVAGTNGKGSVIAFMRAALEAAGHACHVFTSPHLVRFNERIRLAGQLIGEQALLRLLEECEAANGGRPITFFEITTVAAFLAFSRAPAELLLLETGLGGRLDSTNVIARPALTVITSVAIDHERFLGTDLAAIQGEKAGILKPGVACVLAAGADGQPPGPIAARAAAIHAPLLAEGRDWSVTETPSGLMYAGRRRIELPKPALPGGHQVGNAGLAVAALENLPGLALTDADMGQGLATAEWPGRLQRLSTGPLPALLADGWELWLDGGHNPAAAAALASHVRRAWTGKPLYLLLGMLNVRAPEAFMAPLRGLLAGVYCVTIPGQPNAIPAQALAARIDGTPADSLDAALRGLAGKPGPARLLICGSLYLAGHVLAANSR